LSQMSRVTSLLSALLIAALAAGAQPSRISRPIDQTRRVILGGHIHPLARVENDQGRVLPSLPMSYVTVTFGQRQASRPISTSCSPRSKTRPRPIITGGSRQNNTRNALE